MLQSHKPKDRLATPGKLVGEWFLAVAGWNRSSRVQVFPQTTTLSTQPASGQNNYTEFLSLVCFCIFFILATGSWQFTNQFLGLCNWGFSNWFHRGNQRMYIFIDGCQIVNTIKTFKNLVNLQVSDWKCLTSLLTWVMGWPAAYRSYTE